MDRFIVQKLPRNRRYNKYLKSNMDRFIVLYNLTATLLCHIFKIQYGQIYSLFISYKIINHFLFKIQYGQIYSCKIWRYYIQKRRFKIQYGQIYSNLGACTAVIFAEFKIQYGQIYRNEHYYIPIRNSDLKSNMDRFIVEPFCQTFALNVI